MAEGGKGRGSHRRFDYEGLARLAVIGGFYQAGVEITLASRVVRQLGEEASFHGIANLYSFLDKPKSGEISKIYEENVDTEDAFYLHRALHRLTHIYKMDTAMHEDALIDIVDREYVYLNHFLFDEKTQTLVPREPPSALYRVEGWKKGVGEIRLDEAPPYVTGKLPLGWRTARINFKGMIRVNISLAIRNALDAVAAVRGQ